MRLRVCLVARLCTWNGLRQPCRFCQRPAIRGAGSLGPDAVETLGAGAVAAVHAQLFARLRVCLLYSSAAADVGDCVSLRGRPIQT